MNMRWIVSFTMVIGVFGTIFGLAISGMNPWTSPAEADRMYMETAHQQEVYQLEERLLLAETDAEIQAIQREQERLNAQHEHDLQLLAQDVENRKLAFRTLMTVLAIAGSVFSVVLIVGTALWIGSKVISVNRPAPKSDNMNNSFVPPMEKKIRTWPEREPYEPFETPQRRYERRLAERQEEIQAQRDLDELISRMNAFKDPASITREEYLKRPLAGD